MINLTTSALKRTTPSFCYNATMHQPALRLPAHPRSLQHALLIKLILSARLYYADHANHCRKWNAFRRAIVSTPITDKRTTRLSFVRLPKHHHEVDDPSLGLRYRADPLADASDPLSKEVKQVWNRQKGCSDPSQDGRRMVHSEVLVHWYRYDHHAPRYHVANQCDRHQSRRSVFGEGLDDVHVNRQEEGQETVPEDGASGRLSAH
jgi:hypothetical protein